MGTLSEATCLEFIVCVPVSLLIMEVASFTFYSLGVRSLTTVAVEFELKALWSCHEISSMLSNLGDSLHLLFLSVQRSPQ